MISDYLKSSSIFYDLLRKIKHRYYKSDRPRVVYDFNKSILELYKNKSVQLTKMCLKLLKQHVFGLLR